MKNLLRGTALASVVAFIPGITLAGAPGDETITPALTVSALTSEQKLRKIELQQDCFALQKSVIEQTGTIEGRFSAIANQVETKRFQHFNRCVDKNDGDEEKMYW